jgi:hypothetical protein
MQLLFQRWGSGDPKRRNDACVKFLGQHATGEMEKSPTVVEEGYVPRNL